MSLSVCDGEELSLNVRCEMHDKRGNPAPALELLNELQAFLDQQGFETFPAEAGCDEREYSGRHAKDYLAVTDELAAECAELDLLLRRLSEQA